MLRLICLILLVLTSFTAAQTTAPAKARDKDSDEPSDTLQVSTGRIDLAGRSLDYRATAGTIVVKDEHGKEKATVFSVAYEKTPADDPAQRPITFVFNGGPGAASVWLHLGTVGPHRIAFDDPGNPPPPIVGLVPNVETWLDLTDLVFIDPVGTGFSRPAKDEKGEQFYGVDQDVNFVADFIRLYTTRYNRWMSPKLLAGESYGTTRAAALSEKLLDRFGISLSGIVLVSSVLDFQTLNPGSGNDVPYALFLPTYSATAWYHKKLAPELQRMALPDLLRQVESWATGDYVTALTRGSTIDDRARETVVDHLSRYTSLPRKTIQRSNLRIAPHIFRKELLADGRQLVGRFDARITGFDPAPLQSWPDFDPSLSGFLPAYTAGMNDLARRVLKFESDLKYEVLSDRVHPWDFGRAGNGYLNVADELRSAMIKNPRMKILVASGYYDLATPHFATDYTLNRLDLSKELRSNIHVDYYEAGHMMYHHAASRVKLKRDMVRFIESIAR